MHAVRREKRTLFSPSNSHTAPVAPANSRTGQPRENANKRPALLEAPRAELWSQRHEQSGPSEQKTNAWKWERRSFKKVGVRSAHLFRPARRA